MSLLIDDTLLLRAAIELGSENIYSIKNGGLGRTLCVHAGTRSRARKARDKLPSIWEGLYVLVLYNTNQEEEEEDRLSDPSLS